MDDGDAATDNHMGGRNKEKTCWLGIRQWDSSLLMLTPVERLTASFCDCSRSVPVFRVLDCSDSLPHLTPRGDFRVEDRTPLGLYGHRHRVVLTTHRLMDCIAKRGETRARYRPRSQECHKMHTEGAVPRTISWRKLSTPNLTYITVVLQADGTDEAGQLRRYSTGVDHLWLLPV